MEVDGHCHHTQHPYNGVGSAGSQNGTVVLVLDTNIFIHCSDFVQELFMKISSLSSASSHALPPIIVYVPFVVLTELDGLKRTKPQAQQAIRLLYTYWKEGPKHSKCIIGQSLFDKREIFIPFESNPGNDDLILNACMLAHEKYDAMKTILLTNDINLANKAIIHRVGHVSVDLKFGLTSALYSVLQAAGIAVDPSVSSRHARRPKHGDRLLSSKDEELLHRRPLASLIAEMDPQDRISEQNRMDIFENQRGGGEDSMEIDVSPISIAQNHSEHILDRIDIICFHFIHFLDGILTQLLVLYERESHSNSHSAIDILIPLDRKVIRLLSKDHDPAVHFASATLSHSNVSMHAASNSSKSFFMTDLAILFARMKDFRKCEETRVSPLTAGDLMLCLQSCNRLTSFLSPEHRIFCEIVLKGWLEELKIFISR